MDGESADERTRHRNTVSAAPFAGTSRSVLVGALTLGGIITAVALTYLRPLEDTFPVYRELALEMRSGRVGSGFTPLGYPWLISLVPADSIDVAAKVLHVGCYVALATVIGAWLNAERTRPSAILGIAAGAWILFNPYVLVNLYRLNDNNVTVVAMLGLFALLRLAAGSPSPLLLYTAAGVLVAVLAFVRPNAISLLPVVAVSAWLHAPPVRPLHVVQTMASALAALIAYGALSWGVVGAPLFWPGNGPYNLFAGNNPASFAAIAEDYNAEPSLAEGLAWCGVEQPIAEATPSQFVSCTRKFVIESPVQAMLVTAYKIYNLWRPNLRLAGSPVEIAVQSAMVLPSLLWCLASLAIFVRLRRVMDPLATVVVVAFVVPFALTNSDPRFRLPLDAMLVMSLAAPESVSALREMFVPRALTRERAIPTR